MSHPCVNRISRWALILVCAVVLMLSSRGQSWAVERIHLSLDTTYVGIGQTSYLRVWLTNPLDSIAGIKIWLKLDRPNIAHLGTNIDTSGTILSGWEYVDAQSLSGSTDVLLTALCNDINPPVVQPYAPHENRNLLVKIPVTLVPIPDTLSEKYAWVFIEEQPAEMCIFSDQNGNAIATIPIFVFDTTCYRCLQWQGTECLDWAVVPSGPCDSMLITVDTTRRLDTAQYRFDKTRIYYSDCTPVILAGDIDLDGFPLSIGDYIYLIRFITGDTNELPLPTNADVNGDCRISWDDAEIFGNYFTYGQPYLDTVTIANCTCPNPVRYCCHGTRGNVNSQEDQRVDISDLSLMVAYMTGPGVVLKCFEESNINGVGPIDLSDLSILINYLTQGGALPACP